MYKVFGSRPTRSLRVYWALEEMGLAYEPYPAKPQSEEIRALNPSGKVPCLIEDGTALFDSVAIVQYLADKHGKMTHPAGTMARAQQDSFTQFAVDELDGTLWQDAKHRFVLPKELRLEGVRAATEYDMARALRTFGERLGDREFVAGDFFSVADLVLGHCGRWAQLFEYDIPAGPVADYFERMIARPALQRAIDRIDAVS